MNPMIFLSLASGLVWLINRASKPEDKPPTTMVGRAAPGVRQGIRQAVNAPAAKPAAKATVATPRPVSRPVSKAQAMPVRPVAASAVKREAAAAQAADSYVSPADFDSESDEDDES